MEVLELPSDKIVTTISSCLYALLADGDSECLNKWRACSLK